jgi:cysteinyl-tRNA synthetase
LEVAKENVRIALMDDYDTPRVMAYLLELIRDCNRYIEDGNVVVSLALTSVARFITFILKTFGLIIEDSIGFSMSGLNSSDGEGGVSKEQVLTPVLDVLTKFREAVRIAAMNGDSKAVLAAADLLRDDILPELGVRMEDKGSGKDVVTIWKLDDPEVLRKEKAMKEDIKAAKELAKKEAAIKAKEREEKAKINPKDMFLNQLELYSQFDAEGLPSHNKAGEPLSKGAIKKLKKEQDKQKDSFEKFMSKLSI